MGTASGVASARFRGRQEGVYRNVVRWMTGTDPLADTGAQADEGQIEAGPLAAASAPTTSPDDAPCTESITLADDRHDLPRGPAIATATIRYYAGSGAVPSVLDLARSTSLTTTGWTPAFMLARVSGAHGVHVAVLVRERKPEPPR